MSVVYDACVCVCVCVCACVCMCVHACVWVCFVFVIVHWHCSAQLSMLNMEKRYRNKIIIIIIINIHTHWQCVSGAVGAERQNPAEPLGKACRRYGNTAAVWGHALGNAPCINCTCLESLPFFLVHCCPSPYWSPYESSLGLRSFDVLSVRYLLGISARSVGKRKF